MRLVATPLQSHFAKVIDLNFYSINIDLNNHSCQVLAGLIIIIMAAVIYLQTVL